MHLRICAQRRGPAMTVVYYVTDGDEILISSMAKRAKVKAVERNPHVSIYAVGPGSQMWCPTRRYSPWP
jgi:hypothetical protein